MSKVTARISISLDGYAAGANQRAEVPLGDGGERLHEWAIVADAWRRQHGLEGGERTPDSQILEDVVENVGAYIMGRNMFAGPGEWAPGWRGWWGEDPPFHSPVYVLTHHPREPLQMEGGTSFHFVADGIEAALEQARAAAGEREVAIAGGASTIDQYLAAGLLDELLLHLVPITLGGGERLFANVGDVKLEPIEAIASPAVTHLRYRVAR